MLRQGFAALKKAKWKKAYIDMFCQILREQVLNAENDGYKIHITDIYLEELEKAGVEVVSYSDRLVARHMQKIVIKVLNYVLAVS